MCRRPKVTKQSPKVGLLAAGWLCQIHQSTLRGSLGLGHWATELPGWWAVGWDGVGVKVESSWGQNRWAQPSVLGAPLGPLLAGTSQAAQSCQHVCQHCPLHSQSWGRLLLGPGGLTYCCHFLRLSRRLGPECWGWGLLPEDWGYRHRPGAQLCPCDLMPTHRLAPPCASHRSLCFPPLRGGTVWKPSSGRLILCGTLGTGLVQLGCHQRHKPIPRSPEPCCATGGAGRGDHKGVGHCGRCLHRGGGM